MLKSWNNEKTRKSQAVTLKGKQASDFELRFYKKKNNSCNCPITINIWELVLFAKQKGFQEGR